MSDIGLSQAILLARQLRATRAARARVGFRVAMGEEPPPRPTYRGRVISLAAQRLITDAASASADAPMLCALCAPFLTALAAQGGAALAVHFCVHNLNKRGIAIDATGVGAGAVGGGVWQPKKTAFLPRLDTADGFWSLGNAELASLPHST